MRLQNRDPSHLRLGGMLIFPKIWWQKFGGTKIELTALRVSSSRHHELKASICHKLGRQIAAFYIFTALWNENVSCLQSKTHCFSYKQVPSLSLPDKRALGLVKNTVSSKNCHQWQKPSAQSTALPPVHLLTIFFPTCHGWRQGAVTAAGGTGLMHHFACY